MTHEKARAWIKRLPEGRGKPLDAGAKSVLQELWDRVNWSITSDVPASECFVSRERIAREINCPVETVKSRLTALAAAGWIRREREGWALAWERPWPVDPGASKPRPRGIQAPTQGHPSPDPGASKPHIPSPNQVPNQVSDLPPPPSALDARSPTQGSWSPMQAEQTAQGQPRKTRVRRKAQPELPLDDAPTEPDPAAELLALHQRLRSEALARHGISGVGWPGKLTGAGRSLALRVGKALAKHGPEACRRYIEHRAAEWREDAGPLVRYQPDQVWSPKIVDPTIARITGTHARASPGRASPHRLSAPQATHAHSYEPPETETCDL